jgi:hypothetical protein
MESTIIPTTKKSYAQIKTIETYGCFGPVGVVPTFLEAMLKDMETNGVISNATNPSHAEQALAIKAIHDEYLSALMLSSSNRNKFGPLRMDLKYQFGFGEDCYPKSVDQCLSLLNRWGHTAPAPASSPSTSQRAQCLPHDPKSDEALVFAQGNSSKKPSAKDSKETSSKSYKTSKVLVSIPAMHKCVMQELQPIGTYFSCVP